MAVIYGQDEFLRLDDMNAELGEPFTMTCPEGIGPFRWYRGESTDSKDQIAVAVPDADDTQCTGLFTK